MTRTSAWVVFVILAGLAATANGQLTNSWVNTCGGNWAEATSWSLGIVPGPAQSIFVTNARARTIEINAETARRFPQSLTVSNLTLSGSNSLFLNAIGIGAPLTILDALYIPNHSGNAIITSNSALVLNHGGGSYGQIIQYGGTLDARDTLYFAGGGYYLHSGVLHCDHLQAIAAPFTQFGGQALITSLTAYSRCTLYDGELNVQYLAVSGGQGGGSFLHHGGTNKVATLEINPVSGFTMGRGASVSYEITGGLLDAGTLNVFASGPATSEFHQEGGTVQVANQLCIAGSAFHYPWQSTPAIYAIANGQLSAPTLVLDGRDGNCVLALTNSIITVSGPVRILGPTWAPSRLILQSGTLTCSDVINSNGAMSISQYGGALIATNTFEFNGWYPPIRAAGAQPAIYDFADGTLRASHILLDAQWNIGSTSQAGRIENPGTFCLSGNLHIGDANEDLGVLVCTMATNHQYDADGDLTSTPVSTNATICFTGTNTKLSFAKSSNAHWTGFLVISNWNGFLSGEGPHQLKIGKDPSGLTPSQLAQIRFTNPTAMPSGSYGAQILPTGEIVPNAPELLVPRAQGMNLVFDWLPGATLQAATNVVGPYTDVPNATPPHNPSETLPQQFFRLRK